MSFSKSVILSAPNPAKLEGDWYQREYATTGSGAEVVFRLEFAGDTATAAADKRFYLVEVEAVAINAAKTEGVAYKQSVLVENLSGTAAVTQADTLLELGDTTFKTAATLAVAADTATTPDTIKVSVTGGAAGTNWVVRLRVTDVG